MTWKEEILNCLSGQSERDWSSWAGYSSLLQLYNTTHGPNKDALVTDIGDILLDESSDPGIVADLIHLVTTLGITQLSPQIDQLQASGRFTDNSIIQEMLTYNSGMRAIP